MPKVLRDVLGLVDEATAHRTHIDLDETDQIRVFTPDELRDVIEGASATAKVPSARHRKMESRAVSGRIADVVDQEAQAASSSTGVGSLPVSQRVWRWLRAS